MQRSMRALLLAGALAFTAVPASRAAADVQVGINIGIPVPPPIIVAAPPFVGAAGVPTVQYAPGPSVGVFVHGGNYYAWSNGWFVTAAVGRPWAYVPYSAVPAPVLAVPPRYYKAAGGYPRHFGPPRAHPYSRSAWQRWERSGPHGHAYKHPAMHKYRKNRR
jgi:hypothetical protein